jgi:hypothetical protein
MVIGGTREVVRSRSVIEDMSALSCTSLDTFTDAVGLVWAHGQSDAAHGWLVSHSTTLICHLQDCELQPKSVRDRVVLDTTSASRTSPVCFQPMTNLSQVPW